MKNSENLYICIYTVYMKFLKSCIYTCLYNIQTALDLENMYINLSWVSICLYEINNFEEVYTKMYIYAVYEIQKISVYMYIYNVYEIYFFCLYDVYIHAIYTKISLKMSISYRHIDTPG